MTKFSELRNTSRFTSELPADKSESNSPRQVHESCFSFAQPIAPGAPKLLHFSREFCAEIGLEIDDVTLFTEVLSGEKNIKDATPYAMCYGGHQFGQWAGQLGDGRAINIAEVEIKNQALILQLKGSGPTPYSRTADGFAVLRSSIREYLCSEAMHALGVSTTRALSLVTTGDWVNRDIMYNGNPKEEPGAVVCRVSKSFLRFGSFEIFAARNDVKSSKTLVEYAIKHHYPHLGEPSKETYLDFFKEVSERSKEMVIEWQRVGFVHGVMNTDNMSILGQTIDYGPYGWLENYDSNWTPNTTDSQQRRYRFGNQPKIVLWNLLQLANALYPLIEEAEPLEEILESHRQAYAVGYHSMMFSKLGLRDEETPHSLITNLVTLLESTSLDMTLFFRELSNFESMDFTEFWNIILSTSYLEATEIEKKKLKEHWNNWLQDYSSAIAKEKRDTTERLTAMKLRNPKYVLRNYMAQMAIDEAEKGNNELIDELYTLLLCPYDEQIEMEKWYAKRPAWADHKIGCSMLSCSS